MRKTILFLFLGLNMLGSHLAMSQSQQVTLEDLWLRYRYYARRANSINWMKHGDFFTALKPDPKTRQPYILKYRVDTGEIQDTVLGIMDDPTTTAKDTLVFTDYQFTSDESRILLETDPEPIYRHSSKANYFLYNLEDQNLRLLSSAGKQLNPKISPDGQKIAFTRENNLFLKDFSTGKETQITHDGTLNAIINGRADWVYEEEFAFTRGFFWSPDSKFIAFYRFNESEVQEYDMQIWGKELYPSLNTFKYPKAGEKNSKVSIWNYALSSGETKKVYDIAKYDAYIPRVKWTKQGEISIQVLNRHQNDWKLIHVSPTESTIDTILSEVNSTFVDIKDPLIYLGEGGFIRMSDQDGFRHLYHHGPTGKLITQITKGSWEVTDLLSFDPATQSLFYLSTEDGHLDRCFYKIHLDGSGKKRMLKKKGNTQIQLSTDHSHFIATNSVFGSPFESTLHETEKGKQIRVLEDNANLKGQLDSLQLGKSKFFSFTTSEDVELHGYMITPPTFDKSKKYPVLMYVYGGPGSQTVLNQWGGFNYMWYQMLAAKGYIIVSVDGRGTGARGTPFEKSTYGQLGKLETLDQIETAKYLASLPYVDRDRIGIWGWSFGGYLSSLCILKGADLFKLAIAVAPVTSWRFYDTIYTERYLKTPQENPKGYDDNSPLLFADRLKGHYLLIHGSGDDNVHMQNTMAMQRALIDAGKQFSSFIYPDRNHSIYGGVTRYHLYKQMTEFITENL